MEVIVTCAECNSDLEEFKVELAFGCDARIKVVPCPDCLADAVIDTH